MAILKDRLPTLVWEEENLEKIKTAMSEALVSAKTDDLRALLDPSTVETRIEEILFD